MKSQGCNHQIVHGARRYLSRHCLRCGELINLDRAANPNCVKRHKKNRDFDDYCGSCGEKLKPDS